MGTAIPSRLIQPQSKSACFFVELIKRDRRITYDHAPLTYSLRQIFTNTYRQNINVFFIVLDLLRFNGFLVQPTKTPKNNYADMHKELKKKGVTKQLHWEEYKQIYKDNGYQYSQFCQRYRDWVKALQCSMRQIHKAGEKLFIDYCGPTIPIVNPDTGELYSAQVFVATFDASNYTYAEATRSQQKADWIQQPFYFSFISFHLL